MGLLKWLQSNSTQEWATNVVSGKTATPTRDDLDMDFGDARYTGPHTRVRRAMIVYAETRNSYRWRRLKSDYAWLESVVEDMGCNPKDARFLL